jgi:hypothetical protein
MFYVDKDSDKGDPGSVIPLEFIGVEDIDVNQTSSSTLRCNFFVAKIKYTFRF